ncbi:MAG: ferredoxin [Sulfitobacter sp.]
MTPDRLAPHGLMLMGALHWQGDTLHLIGADHGFWPIFTRAPENADGLPDPIDRWSKRVLGALAAQTSATPHFPSDGPPYAPFIAWALASGRFWSSPTGMMVHDRAGLMISLRGALQTKGTLPLPPVSTQNPCTRCAAKPCTAACPVGALGAHTAYDVPRCKEYLSRPAGQSCMQSGCAARRACPVSQNFNRDPAQSAFHMRAFTGQSI